MPFYCILKRGICAPQTWPHSVEKMHTGNMKFNIKHFLLLALLLSFTTLAIERYHSSGMNKMYADVAFAVTSGIIVIVVFAFVMEINRAARIHAALVLREEYLRETLNSLDEGVITTDTGGFIQQMNPSAEILTGWKHNEAYGQSLETVFNVTNEETGKRFEHVVKRILSNGKRVVFENNTVLKSKDGRDIIISNNGAPIYDDRKKLVGAVLVFRDITAKKQAEEKLNESFNTLQLASEIQASILDALPAKIALLNKHGIIVDVNESWVKYGYENGLGCASLGVGENYIGLLENMTDAAAETGRQLAGGIKKVIYGDLQSFEMEYLCHYESIPKWYNARIAPLNKKGSSGVVVMHIEITEKSGPKLHLVL